MTWHGVARPTRGCGRRGGWQAFALGLLLLVGGPAAAEVVKVEAVGVVPAGQGAPPGESLRQAALEAGVAQAVVTAGTEFATSKDPFVDRDMVSELLRADAFAYTTRFRLLEDRGERSALLIEDPDVEREYAVLVEAYVDLDRVSRKLAESGLLVFQARAGPAQRLRVGIQGVEHYATYQRIHEALAAHSRSVQPVEFSRGRVVFEVESALSSSKLLRATSQDLRAELELVPIRRDASGLELEVFDNRTSARKQ